MQSKISGKKYEKILIVGAGGGREHAIGWKVAQSPRAGKLFFARGNAGTAQLGENLDIKDTEISALVEFAKQNKIDLTLATNDDSVALGLVDEFKKAGLRIWGPTKAASQLEWSKTFSKNFMKKHGLPTAKFEIFNDYNKALEYVRGQNFPLVIKANGLALGKGVVICATLDVAQKALEEIMVKKIFGESGREVVIEEFMVGPEISIHAFSDGKNYKMFPPSQDHKKIGEGDTGLNTGGVGTIAPLPFIHNDQMREIEKNIVASTLSGMQNDGAIYEGILYPGLMLTDHGHTPKILEYNARFGDPEAQVYVRLLENDILDVIDASIDGKLNEIEVKWQKTFACNIVLCSEGYPGSYEKGKIITGIKDAEKNGNVVVFHAGTKRNEKGELVTNGGRVLGVSATGLTLQKALHTAYEAISKIHFEGLYFRKDIGGKALLLSKKR